MNHINRGRFGSNGFKYLIALATLPRGAVGIVRVLPEWEQGIYFSVTRALITPIFHGLCNHIMNGNCMFGGKKIML